jgi:hypothetical protein
MVERIGAKKSKKIAPEDGGCVEVEMDGMQAITLDEEELIDYTTTLYTTGVSPCIVFVVRGIAIEGEEEEVFLALYHWSCRNTVNEIEASKQADPSHPCKKLTQDALLAFFMKIKKDQIVETDKFVITEIAFIGGQQNSLLDKVERKM